jgi:hypothetical protein
MEGLGCWGGSAAVGDDAAAVRPATHLRRRVFEHSQVMAVLESFQSQTLSPPAITAAIALGQSGTWCPATSTSTRATNRNICPRHPSPNIVPATRNPRICEFMLGFSRRLALVIS